MRALHCPADSTQLRSVDPRRIVKAVIFDLFETLVSHRDPDWTPPLRTKAARLGVDQDLYDTHWGRFEKRWERGEVGLLKPEPEIYELACDRLEIHPRRAVFVGDGGSNELRGAADAGIRPLWASWFLDRWPGGVRPGGFAGGEWRQGTGTVRTPFERLRHPADLLDALGVSATTAVEGPNEHRAWEEG